MVAGAVSIEITAEHQCAEIIPARTVPAAKVLPVSSKYDTPGLFAPRVASRAIDLCHSFRVDTRLYE